MYPSYQRMCSVFRHLENFVLDFFSSRFLWDDVAKNLNAFDFECPVSVKLIYCSLFWQHTSLCKINHFEVCLKIEAMLTIQLYLLVYDILTDISIITSPATLRSIELCFFSFSFIITNVDTIDSKAFFSFILHNNWDRYTEQLSSLDASRATQMMPFSLTDVTQVIQYS